MADNRSKALQKPTNRKKSVKQNRNFIRLRIPTFYTIIFTTAFKIVQIVASFSQNHRTARYMAEASLPLFHLPIVPRELTYLLLPSHPYDTKTPLRRSEV